MKVVDLTENLRLSAELGDDPELERLPLTTDSSRVDQCVASLREVLGPLGELLIKGQYSGHVTCIDQSEASIYVT